MPRNQTTSSSAKQSWPPIVQRKYPSGKTAFQIAVMVDGERIRETFKTKGEAEIRAQEIRATKQREGALAFKVPVDLRIEASKCQDKLKPFAATLTEAVDYYVDHVLVFRQSPAIREIVAKLIEEKEHGNRRASTLIELRHRLGRFAEAFGDRRLGEITADQLADWVHQVAKSPFSQRNYRKKLIQLWRYAIRRKWCFENIAEQTERPELDETVPGILTVDQCAQLLKQAAKYDMLAHAVLGMFCGIRTEEIAKLTWPDVNLTERSVIIGPKVAKKRRQRIVPLNDAALAWLKPCVKKSGPVIDPTNLRKRFDEWRSAAGITNWPDNALRHSFGSYHLAAYGDDIQTARLMGHRSPDVLHAHYKALVSEAEAKRFWELRPTKSSHVKATSSTS